MLRRLCGLFLSLCLLLSAFSGLSFTAEAAVSFTKASSVAVGDQIVIVSEAVSMELSGISTTSTKYGLGKTYSAAPSGLMVLEVCEGFTVGSYAFRYDGKYLYWGSGNTLNVNATLSNKTSWTVSFDDAGNAVLYNVHDTARRIWWNNISSGQRFAAYTAKEDDNNYKDIQIYKASGKVCTHSNSTYSVVSPATCQSTGVGRYTCTDCGYSWTVSIALGAHSYALQSVDGVQKMVCSVCGDAQNVTIVPIAQAKAYVDQTALYTVQGIVTYISGRTVYIEDATGGLCVYFATGVDTSALALGDEICVSSTMTTYEGLVELDKPASYTLISAGNALPETSELTVADILSDTSLAHVGKRVLLGELALGTINAAGLTALTDTEGDTIAVFRLTGLNENIVAGNIVDVTAIVSYYKDSVQLLINPATAKTDVVKVAEGIPVVIETVPIATAKNGIEGTYYQVEGVVTCVKGRQIFMQDTTGGIVVYLSKMPSSAPCKVGDCLRVLGAFGNYDGVLELQYVDHTNPDFFTVLSSGHSVAAQTVTIEKLLSDSSYSYDYFAEKIFLDNASILEIDFDGTILLWQNDYTIHIYKAPSLNENCVVGAVVDVTATVSGYSYNYELVIADADQIVYGGDCLHTDTAYFDEIPPTCTEEGYSGDLRCTICGEFMQEGETIPPQHNTVLVNAVEATCDAAGYSGDAYCEVCGETVTAGTQIAPLGHAYVGTVTPPSCTENGYTTYRCSRCESTYEGEITSAVGHSYTYSDNGDVHVFTCGRCGMKGSESHIFDNGRCLLCSAVAPSSGPAVDDSIVIQHSLNLASDISINFTVKTALLADYDSFWLECVKTDYEGNQAVGTTVVVIEEPTVSGPYYYFTLTGINALQMGDLVHATLHMTQGTSEFVSNTDIYSVATYAYSQLNKASTNDALKSLCANLLRYGAATQIYKGYRTDALADAAMTAEHRAYITPAESVVFGNQSRYLGDLSNPTVTWLGRTLLFNTKLSLRFVFDVSNYKGSLADLNMRVSYVDYLGRTQTVKLTELEKYGSNAGWYSFIFDSLRSAELRAVVNVAVYQGDTRISETMQYSADTFGNGKTGDLLLACQTLIAYSDAALAFFSEN